MMDLFDLNKPKSDKDNNNSGSTGLNVNTEGKAIDVDIQRFILDTEALHRAFYYAFCGWSLRETEIEEETPLGIKRKVKKSEIIINRNTRMLNESGADYLYNAFYSLISQIATTSTSDYKRLYKLYIGRLDSITFALLDSYYFDGNPFEIRNPDLISDIIATLTSMILITEKAEGGFTLKQITETIISSFIRKEIPTQKSGSIFEKYFNK